MIKGKASDMTGVFKLERTSGPWIVEFDDQKANAINGPFLDELDGVLDVAERESAPALVMSGRPGFYSGGLDLKTLPTLSPEELRGVLRKFSEVMLRAFTFPRPIVAECTGHAIAGGCVFLLAADERIARLGPYKIGLNETAIGLSLPSFVVEMARTQLPPQFLSRIIVRGELFSPETAERLHLVDKVVEATDSRAQAIARASALAELPKSSYADNKLRVRGEAAKTGQRMFDKEEEAFMAFLHGAARG